LKAGEIDSNPVVACFQSIQREPPILAGSHKSHLRITPIDSDRCAFKWFGRTTQHDATNIAYGFIEHFAKTLTLKGPAGRNE